MSLCMYVVVRMPKCTHFNKRIMKKKKKIQVRKYTPVSGTIFSQHKLRIFFKVQHIRGFKNGEFRGTKF